MHVVRNNRTTCWAKVKVKRDKFACNIAKIRKHPTCTCMLLFRPLMKLGDNSDGKITRHHQYVSCVANWHVLGRHGVLTQKTEKHSCRASGLGEAYLDSFAARLVYCLVGNYFQRDIDRPGPLAYILPKHALLGGLIGQSLHEICRQDPLG